jgi:hypothetical protein
MYLEYIFMHHAEVLTRHGDVLMYLSDVLGCQKRFVFQICFKNFQAINYIQINEYFEFILIPPLKSKVTTNQ